METENRYHFNLSRFLSLWSLPIILLAMLTFLFFSKYEKLNEAKSVQLLALSLFMLFCVGPFAFLFFNHLPLARRTMLIIKDKILYILIDGQQEKIEFLEIKNITEYSTAKLPWSSIRKWIISANEKEYVISSLTISNLNFERHFYDKIETKVSFLPMVLLKCQFTQQLDHSIIK
jgi:hypothetical protein